MSAASRRLDTNDKQYTVGQIYAEYMIPAKQLHPYPVIMVHGGTMSGTNYTGTPDGREGWEQDFVRAGYAVYVVDQVGKGRSPYYPDVYGAYEQTDMSNNQGRYVAQEKSNLWPQAHLHTQWPGGNTLQDPAVQQLMSSQIASIKDFHKQQELNVAGLIALVDKIGPSILLIHSQAGAFVWPVADARPNLVKGILAIEPNGPPVHNVEYTGAPDWFKYGGVALSYGLTDVPLTYAPAVKDASELKFVQQDKSRSGPTWCAASAQGGAGASASQSAEDAGAGAELRSLVPRALRPLHGALPAAGRGASDLDQGFADLGIHGNGHFVMLEKNSLQIAGVIIAWANKAIPPRKAGLAGRRHAVISARCPHRRGRLSSPVFRL